MTRSRTDVKHLRLLLCVLVGAVLFVAGVSTCQWHDKASALDMAREWARLAPYPPTASKMHVEVGGGMFTRSFRVEFDAPLPDIDRWLAASPGPAAATIERQGRIRRYTITPGGGAQRAWLTVDEARSHATVCVEWS